MLFVTKNLKEEMQESTHDNILKDTITLIFFLDFIRKNFSLIINIKKMLFSKIFFETIVNIRNMRFKIIKTEK
jgi:hypothetical protein